MSIVDTLTDEEYEALIARCDRACEAVYELAASLRRVRKQRDEANKRILSLEAELEDRPPIVYAVPRK